MAKSKKSASLARMRSAARFCAIQALYQVALLELSAQEVVTEYTDFRLDGEGLRHLDGEDHGLIDPDRTFFADLVEGVQLRLSDIDALINTSLEKGWTTERLEIVMRCILRAGGYELISRLDVPPKVIISEYVEAAHAFFCDTEPKLVNGVLDKMARTLRPEAFTPSS